MINPIQIRPTDATREVIELNMKAVENLIRLNDEEIIIGPTPKEPVYREDNVILYHYKPMVDNPFKIPVLIVYALVNRPYMVDLQENRSLVRNLLELGIDVYLVDWGYPQRGDRWLTIDDYVDDYINNCVEFVANRHGLDKINLLGICQGGTLSLCYAAICPQNIKNLIVMVAPVDFHVGEGLLNLWSGCSYGSECMNVDVMVDALGNIPGDFMNYGYLMLKPFQLNVEKYLGMADILDDEAKLINFLRMEKWIFDSPDQAGETFRQFIRDFYQANKLIKGEFRVGNKYVNLGNIKMPVLNLYAEKDHLVPPASSIALEKYVGTKDYSVNSFPVGHIGMYVSGQVQKSLPPTIAEWLKERT